MKVRTNGKEIVANTFVDSSSQVTLWSRSLVERLDVDQGFPTWGTCTPGGAFAYPKGYT